MGRSKESLKRKRPRSRDVGYPAKRHNATAGCNKNSPKRGISSQTSTDNSSQLFCDVLRYPQIPYFSWTMYFNSYEYHDNSPTVKRIDALMEYFETNNFIFEIEYEIDLDINLLFQESNLLQKWFTIVIDFRSRPQYVLNCIKVAIFEVSLRRETADCRREITKVSKLLQLTKINIINYESYVNVMPCIKLSCYGQLISIDCTVTSVGLPKVCSKSVVFVCKCGRQIIAKQFNEFSTVPEKCNVCGSNEKFTRFVDSPYEVTRISQTIEAKDHRSINRTVDDGSNSPNNISVNLAGHLIDQCMPGDKITVIGIPRMTIGGTKCSTVKSPLYVDAISLLRHKYDFSSIKINEKAIERIRAEKDVFSLLVQSLCPAVPGREILKAALILSLVCGNFGNKGTRDSVHTLIIGNLGLGKSELLRACAQAAPRGVYIRGSSGTALEPSMINVRDTGTEDYRLEIGGLASANQTVCCIDELEKISAQHQVISKAMESPAVRIVNSELQTGAAARTSIVGIINPIKKRYDVSKTVTENVNADHFFLSQFDMVFLMRDNPNMDRDKLMCDRFLDNQIIRPRLAERAFFDNRMETNSHADRIRNLREILADRSNSEILPQELLRMYISHVRSSVQTEVSRESRALIEWICLQRQQAEDLMKFERLLRKLVLLVQARAKIDFRAETTERDVYDVAEILEHAVSPNKKNRALASLSNSGKLTGNKMNQFLSDLKNDVALLNKRIFTMEELRNIAGKENITGTCLSTLISRLNDHGYLLKKPNNTYEVVIN